MKKYFTSLLLVTLAVLLASPGAVAQVLPGTFAAGATHSLAIHADGTLWATGDNTYGQLGTGTTTSHATWVQVGSGATWVRVAAGEQHSLALQANGSLWAWGSNTYGQLGTSTTSGAGYEATPTQVPGTYTQLAAGASHSLALQANGTLYAWGRNTYGQLGNANGNGLATPTYTPTPLAGTYSQLAAGYDFSLALRPDGTLWAWGRNTYGQLGNATGTGTDAASPTPTQVPGTYTQLAAGASHSLALQANGTLYAWGTNALGQLGNGSPTPAASPTPAPVPGTYVQLAAGTGHSLALRASGALYAWGSNAAGQLGGPVATTAPVATGTALPTRSTAMGSSFGLAVRADGTLWTWGDNGYGQLGDGSTTSRTRPLQVGADNDWVQVAAGTSHSLALKANGTLWAWGLNNRGQLGSSTNSSTNAANAAPIQISPDLYTSVAAGAYHSLALRADGSLYAWGYNYYGQLGNGASTSAAAANPTPSLVSGTYTQAAAGITHSVALQADGSLWAWGGNDQGQLGVSLNFGGGNLTTVPTRVAAPYTAAAAGSYHTLALAADGTLATWGSNDNGQLGNVPLTTTRTFAASPVAGLYSQVAAGGLHSLALRADGTLWAWGRNAEGQLGRGNATSTNTNVPTQEATLATTWTTLATGNGANFSLVRAPSGLTFASSGQNASGQLGNGTASSATRFDRLISLSQSPLPVQLLSFGARRTAAATVALAWATATELHNAGFGIERSADGVAFTPIGFVAGRSQSATTLSYTFQDNAAAGPVYYRLAQADTDGSITFSPVQFVAAAAQGLAATLQLVPNPAPSGLVQALGMPEGATLAVYDTMGRLLRPATTAATLDVAGLVPGVYVVRAQAPGQPAQSARLLVQ